METTDILKKVRKIEIKTRELSHHIFSGQYHSAFKGRGMAFSEVREYQYGDDVRFIDWNVTARFHHPYVKIFEEERELTVMLLIDVSGSNFFGSQKQLKKDTITEIAATLAFSAIQNNDKVGVIFFSDKVEKYIPPKKGRSHILFIIRELLEFKARDTKTNMSEALRYFNNVHKRKSTVFIISDFIDKNYEDAIKIVSQKHDVSAIRIYDTLEASLPNVGLLRLRDNETGLDFTLDTSLAQNRKNYEEYWKTHDKNTDLILKKYGLRHVHIATREDYVKHLIHLFKKR